VLIEDACRGIAMATSAGGNTVDEARSRLAGLGVRFLRSDDLLG
jgi:hypothetical protein